MSTPLVLTYDISGSNYNLVLPLSGAAASINIVWGDGSNNNYSGTVNYNISHNYVSGGYYTVSITGSGITNLDNRPGGTQLDSAQYLISCLSFGEIGLTNLKNAFRGAVNLTSVPNGLPSSSTITEMTNMFGGATIFNYDINNWDVSGVTYMAGMFEFASSFNQDLSSWNVSSVTVMNGMFLGANSFNQDISNWNVSSVTDMDLMFLRAYSFNQDLSRWDVSKVTTMESMFYHADSFNQDLSTWDVSKVTNMGNDGFGIFDFCGLSTTNYNAILTGWSKQNVQQNVYFNGAGLVYSPAGFLGHNELSNNGWVFDGDAFIPTNNIYKNTNFSFTVNAGNNYFGISGYVDLSSNYLLPNVTDVYYDANTDNQIYYPNLSFTSIGNRLPVLLYSPPGPLGVDINITYYLDVLENITCFKEDSKILTDKGYRPIQDLRKGDMVKTCLHNYKAIDMIGKREVYHPASNERIKDQLYKCSQLEYPELVEDLIITGCHCILVDNFVNDEQKEKTIEVNGKICVTDNKYRLPACVDDRTSVYETKGKYTIYHLALENDDYYMNYGVYANGLLVETCSKRYLKELSEMTLIE